MKKTDGHSSPSQHGGKGVIITLNPTQHRSQQCHASVVSTERIPVLPVQPPAQANRQK